MRTTSGFLVAFTGFLLTGCASDSATKQALQEALASVQRVADTITEEIEAARKKIDGTETGGIDNIGNTANFRRHLPNSA